MEEWRNHHSGCSIEILRINREHFTTEQSLRRRLTAMSESELWEEFSF